MPPALVSGPASIYIWFAAPVRTRAFVAGLRASVKPGPALLLFTIYVGFTDNLNDARLTAALTLRQGKYVRYRLQAIKTLNHACPSLTITSSREKADFIVVWDIKTWAQTSWSGHQNEFAVYDKAGDLIKSGAAHKQTNAAKDI